jgi:hypothetical protein
MSSKKSLYIPAVLIFTSFLGASGANAQIPKCYTLQSLQGNYAVIGNYGANVAIAFGARNYDGNGNLSATFILNEPTVGSATGARTLVTGTQVGTYTVNCNGTGKITRVLSASNGITSVGVDDFVITTAVVIGGQLIATTIIDAQQTPSAIVAGGIFLTRVHSRLPDFNN